MAIISAFLYDNFNEGVDFSSIYWYLLWYRQEGALPAPSGVTSALGKELGRPSLIDTSAGTWEVLILRPLHRNPASFYLSHTGPNNIAYLERVKNI